MSCCLEVTICDLKASIVGGESGPGAQPMQELWVTRLRDQCEKAGAGSVV
jgi:protein gp37